MYKLSKIVPVPMKSCYTDSVMGPICVSWWQWRNRVFMRSYK